MSHPLPRTAVAVLALVGAVALSGCTDPDGGAAPGGAVDATISAADGSVTQPEPEPEQDVTTEAPVQSVQGGDGSQTRVAAGSAELLAEVPVEIPLVAGDADLVQVTDPGDPAASTYHVVITSPGGTAAVLADVTAEFAAAGFATESLAPEEGAPATAAAVFADDVYRVTVGLVPAGRTSTTVVYVIVPAS